MCAAFSLPRRLDWLLVLSLYKEDYLQFFKCVSFWLQGCCSWWEGWSLVNRFNHTSCVAVVTPTDCPYLPFYSKSVRNRCIIDVWCRFFLLSCWFVCDCMGLLSNDWVRSLPFSRSTVVEDLIRTNSSKVNDVSKRCIKWYMRLLGVISCKIRWKLTYKRFGSQRIRKGTIWSMCWAN